MTEFVTTEGSSPIQIHSMRNVRGADVIEAGSVKNARSVVVRMVRRTLMTGPTAADQRLLGLLLPAYAFIAYTTTAPSLKSPVLRRSKPYHVKHAVPE